MSLTIEELCALPMIPHLGLAKLMRFNFDHADMRPLYDALIKQVEANPEDAGALLDASVILQFYGNESLALLLQREAVSMQRHYCFPATHPARLRLLVLVAPGDLMANTPIECLLEDSDIELHLYYVTESKFNRDEIPAHDVLFVALSETDENRPLLDFLVPILTCWPQPVLNDPKRIPRVARDTATRLLSTVPGVLVPSTFRVSRQHLAAVERDPGKIASLFPLLVRPVDSHAGNDFHKVDDPQGLGAVLETIPGDEMFFSPFIDYRSADGLFRKYRVVLIAGIPFACHMGISDHWMIHYLNAGMAESLEKRAEEADFMAQFDSGFAARHAGALSAINERIGLDYLGIDCAETADGSLLIFEIDHAMVVHAMDSVEVYPYKQDAMHKLFGAFRRMLVRAVDLRESDLGG